MIRLHYILAEKMIKNGKLKCKDMFEGDCDLRIKYCT